MITIYLLAFVFLGYSYARVRFYEKNKQLFFIFLMGLIARLFSALAFGLIYDFYYLREADTFYYFWNASRLSDLLWKDPGVFLKVMVGNVTPEDVYSIVRQGYYPVLHDKQIYFLHRLLAPFVLLGLKNYYLSALVLGLVLYFINWRVFMFFYEMYQQRVWSIAFAVLLLPSALFWSSGLLKDSFTYSFSLLFFVFFYNIFMNYQFRLHYILYMIVSGYVVLNLKPYVLLALVISLAAWIAIAYMKNIRNAVVRLVVTPIFVIVGLAVGSAGIYVISHTAGGHFRDAESMLQKAVISYEDLKQEYYQGASFDLGEYEPTIGGALSKAPLALNAALFRPYLWEARSITMLFSGIENTVLLMLFVYLLVAGRMYIIRRVIESPFYMFCVFYSGVLGVIVGLSTSNFGALVRFKIPLLPFFVMLLLFLYDDLQRHKKQKLSI